VIAEKEKIDIRSLSLEALQKHFIQMDEKSFRAKQVYEWLWKKSCFSFDEMSNISKELRTKLDKVCN
jgi:23S rRNA (adenine2503-C2)-methyltransferase